jgi:hypothetical protein
MTPDAEIARLAGYLRFYREQSPDPEAVTEARDQVPRWVVDQMDAAVGDTPALEFAVAGAISRVKGQPVWRQHFSCESPWFAATISASVQIIRVGQVVLFGDNPCLSCHDRFIGEAA